MTKIYLKLLVLVCFTLAVSASVHAQATRTWVSGVGDDVNPCSRTAPCKTYAGAISKTAKDGEISTLDPGGFGAVTITKSITINGGGGGQGYGSILSALAPQGVLINITDVNDVRKAVRLDWLNINGASTGTDGIRFIAGNSLHITNCLIDGVVGQGIEVNVTAGVKELYISDTTVRNAATDGILLRNTGVGGLVLATIERSQILDSAGDGIEAGARAHITIRECTISTHNGAASAGVRTSETAESEANIDGSTLTFNVDAVRVDLGTARVSNSTISGNGTALRNVAGTLKTWQNNMSDANANVGAITPILQN